MNYKPKIFYVYMLKGQYIMYILYYYNFVQKKYKIFNFIEY